MESPAGLALQPDPARYTLPRFLADVAKRFGRRTALRFEGRGFSYTEIEALAQELAKGLVACGVVKGTRVGLLCANRPEWVVAAFAVAATGAVLVPVNTFATAAECDHVLRHGDVSVLLLQRGLGRQRFADGLAERHAAIRHGRPGAIRCDALPQLRRVVCFDAEEPIGAIETGRTVMAAGESVSDGLLAAVASEIAPSDEALVIYTSGTTALPKGVVHRHRAPVIQAWRFAELMGLTPEDRVYTAQPFFWTAGIAMSLGATMAAGATLILEETFDAGRALEVIERERATTVHAWPHQEKAMAEHPDAARRDLSRVKRVEFDGPLASVIPLEKDAWGMYGSYGLSETFTLVTALPADAPAGLRHSTHGAVLPGNAVRIVDPETGAPRAPGETGEIAVKGPTLMAGYVKVPPEHVFDADGWFRTRDEGRLDDQGRLHWRGRLSNLIKTAGANVAPAEIEAAVGARRGVRSAHVVGVPHPTLGEAIVLCLIATADGSEIEDLGAFPAQLAERLSSYKVPRAVLVFRGEDVAYTGSQKVQLAELRSAALRRLARDAAEIGGHRYGTADLPADG